MPLLNAFPGIEARPTGGGGDPFAPGDVAGLVFDLDPSLLALADDDPVAAGTDGSGQGNDYAQATSGARPLYKATAANGEPALLFDGADDFLSVTDAASLKPTAGATVVAVTRNLLLPGGTNPYVCNKNPASLQLALFARDFGASDPQSMAAGFRVAGAEAVAGPNDTEFYVDGGWHVLVGRYTGAAVELFVDGLLRRSVAASGALDTTTDPFLVGSYDGSGLFWNGYVARLLLYNTAISDADRWALVGFLGALYGVP